MGLFEGIKKFFGKTIGIGAKQEGQLVYMYPINNGRLKLTTEVEVKPGFVAVVMHYDTVCDILTEGNYKCASGQMPKLNRFVKPRLTFKGYVAPKKVVADIYFINLNWFEKLPYSLSEVPAGYGDKRYFIKLDGTFDMQVTNAMEFIKALLKDRSTLRHGVAEIESGNVVSEEIYKTLLKFEQELEGYLRRDGKIIEIIEEGLKNNANENGFAVKNITIGGVKVPKRLKRKLGLEETEEPLQGKEENIEEFKKEILQTKQEEETRLEPQKQKVFVGGGVSETPPKVAAHDYYDEIASKMNSGEIKPQTAPNILRDNADAGSLQGSYGASPLDMVRPAGGTLFNQDGTPFAAASGEYNAQVSSVQPDSQGEHAPSKTKHVSAKTEPILPEIRCPQCSASVQVGKKFCQDCGYNMQGFVVCPSCGAKNRFEDKNCMVCKSRL